MNFSQFLLILHGRRKLVLQMLVITVLAALAASLLQKKTYTSTATLVLNYKGTDPVTGVTLPAQLMPGYMATQMDIVGSTSTALMVVDKLRLAENPETRQKFVDATDGKGSIRHWVANSLLKQLKVSPMRESSVLNISYTARTPRDAADIANAFAWAYQNTSVRLTVEPAKKAAGYFNEQLKLLRDKVESAQRKMSAYQQANGLVGIDNHLDVETARLNELSTQLAVAQGQALEATSRRDQARGLHADESPDVASSPLVQDLKGRLAQAQVQLAGISQRYTEEHPLYLKAKAEVDRLRAELRSQVRSSSANIARNARILEQRESDLQSALDTQKAKVLALNRKRDELKVLNNEVESAQRNYEAAAQRFTQTSLEGQSNQTDVAVLNPAAPPFLPAGPKIVLNLMLAIFLGLMLGIGFAILAELRDRRVRSALDLATSLQAPVLGELKFREPALSRLDRRRVLAPPRIAN